MGYREVGSLAQIDLPVVPVDQKQLYLFVSCLESLRIQSEVGSS